MAESIDMFNLLMDNNVILDVDETGEHYLLASGRHSGRYLEKRELFKRHGLRRKVSRMMSSLLVDLARGERIDAIVGPPHAGERLATMTFDSLYHEFWMSTELFFLRKHDDGIMEFEKDILHLVQGKRILIIEDIATTGDTVKKLIDYIQQLGAQVACVAIMIRRDITRVSTGTLGVPVISLLDFEVEDFDPLDCPYCRAGLKLSTVHGHG